MKRPAIALSILALGLSNPDARGFQIAPVGSKVESRLTKETDSRLAEVAGRLGVIIKHPVHEEITHLGFGCPVEPAALVADDFCATRDGEAANPYIIYGVRWNDLPPFRLNPGQGAGCKKLGFLKQPACNTDQTVRFSTQPDCWYCLFKDASRIATSHKITGCEKGPEFVQGTLMTRSHFGDLQFFHAMARDEGTPPEVTRRKILDWIEFAWRVFDKEIRHDALLKDVPIPTIQEHFGCSSWTVADIYVLGQGQWLRPRLADIAFGSILHTIQDSFAAGHVTRESPSSEMCMPEMTLSHPGRIEEFHTYGSQDSNEHDAEDSRTAMAMAATEAFPDAVEITKQLFLLYDDNAPWERARHLFSCVFELSASPRPSSPGPFRKRE